MDTATTTTYLPGNAMRRFRFRFSVAYVSRLICVLLMMAPHYCSQISNEVPPVIVDGPPPHIIYNPKGGVILQCTGNGSMNLSYEWYRNGELLRPNSKIKISEEGRSLNLNEPDEGYYQCKVRNMAGVAVSNVTFLQPAVCEATLGRKPIQNVTVKLFESLVLHCSHLERCNPSAKITWKFQNDTSVQLDSRVLVTDNGSLVFRYILPSDANGDYTSYYRCVAYNFITRRELGGSYYHIKVSTETSSEAPKILYSSESPVYALEGKSVNLSCIFNEPPQTRLVKDEWIFPNGTKIEAQHVDIARAQLSDQGNYSCLKGTTQKTIQVIVDALPQVETKPQSQTAARNSTVYFICHGRGRPKPHVVWFINGNHSHHGDRLVLTNVQNSLSITCNVSNKYGYELSSAFLLVLDAIATTSSHNRNYSTPILSGHNATTMMTTTLEGYQQWSVSSKRNHQFSVTDHVTLQNVTPSNNSNQLSQGGGESKPGVIQFLLVLLVLPLALVPLVIWYCRQKRRGSFRLSKNGKPETVELRSKKDPELNCDSDDSGYEDRKTSGARQKHTIKRLSDTPEEDSYL